MSNIYFSSDLHLGHKNIIRLCNRPYKHLHEMNEGIIDNFNSIVNKDDTVYLLGDIIWGGVNWATTCLNRLNGKLVLIRGNHDKGTLKVPERFESIHNLHETSIDGQRVIMCHYPMLEWAGSYRRAIHLFGHSHGNLNKKYWGKGTGRYDVGVDSNNYKPITLKQVKDILNA